MSRIFVAQEFTKALLRRDPSYINKPDRTNERPIHRAVANAPLSDIEFLLDAGTDVTKATGGIDGEGNTPLHVAAKRTSQAKSIAEALINAGAEIEETNDAGQTPLNVARIYGDDDLVDFLKDTYLSAETERETLQEGRTGDN